MEQVKLQFPDLDMTSVPPHALSPMVRRLLDPDGMGATPTHQTDTQQADTLIWEPKEGSDGKSMLLVPFCNPNQVAKRPCEGHLGVEG